MIPLFLAEVKKIIHVNESLGILINPLDQWFLPFSVTFPTLEHPATVFPTQTLSYDVK